MRLVALCRRISPCHARRVRCGAGRNYFGKDGLRGGGGAEGPGGNDLAKLLGGQGGAGLDLGAGIDLSKPQNAEEDPLNYDPEGMQPFQRARRRAPLAGRRGRAAVPHARPMLAPCCLQLAGVRAVPVPVLGGPAEAGRLSNVSGSCGV